MIDHEPNEPPREMQSLRRKFGLVQYFAEPSARVNLRIDSG